MTRTFIYHDTFFYFDSLEEQTDYIMFYYMEDLSGNVKDVQSYSFKTKLKFHPALFSIKLTEDIPVSEVIDKLAMLSLQPKDRLVLISAPKKFNIANVTDPKVLKLLREGTTTYTFMLLHNKTGDSPKPIEIVDLMEETKWLLTETDKRIIEQYNWNSNAHEVWEFDQEFYYPPKLQDITQNSVKFNVSCTRNGTVYAILLPHGAKQPTPRQL